jgi:hypothetical protein
MPWWNVPQVPRPHTTRGRWLARQRADDAQGRFSERVEQYVFPPIDAQESATLVKTVTSQGGRFVRCLAIRGTVASDRVPDSPLNQSLVFMRLQLQGDNDFIGANGTNFASFASLFDNKSSPWFRFLSPILLRTGDLLTCTVINGQPVSEVSPLLTAQVGLRLIDEDLWQELYTRDWRSERDCC